MADYVLSCCSPCDLSNEWVEKRDIKRACRLMYATETLCVIVLMALALAICIAYYR